VSVRMTVQLVGGGECVCLLYIYVSTLITRRDIVLLHSILAEFDRSSDIRNMICFRYWGTPCIVSMVTTTFCDTLGLYY
jgi:hypothetical protein